jgi:hypothetical protein
VKAKSKEYWHPPAYEDLDVRAMQALAAGDASETEQQRALQWIIEQACAVYDEPFRPGDPSVVNYMLGRRSVGLAIIKLMKLSQEIFNDKRDFREDDGGNRRDRSSRRGGRNDRNRDGSSRDYY